MIEVFANEITGERNNDNNWETQFDAHVYVTIVS